MPPESPSRADPHRRLGLIALAALAWVGLAWVGLGGAAAAPSEAPPLRIGMTAEFGLAGSASAQAIALGIRAALHHAASHGDGGPLGGRRVVLEMLDDSAIPARAVDNALALADQPNLLALFVGRFSPPVFDLLPIAHQRGLILLSAWAAADGLTTYPRPPNPLFRLALRDAVAVPTLLEHARAHGWRRLGALLPNTAAGRSVHQATERALTFDPELKLLRARWFNFGDQDMPALWDDLTRAGAEAVILVATEREAALLARGLAADPNAPRAPVLAHGVLAGGDLHGLIAGRDVAALDLFIALTAAPEVADPAALATFHADLRAVGAPMRPERMVGWMGAAQAYDLTTLLLIAVDRAGSADAAAVRAALEADLPFTGVTGHYPRPFAPDRHDAMAADKAFIARMRPDASLIPVGPIGARQGGDR